MHLVTISLTWAVLWAYAKSSNFNLKDNWELFLPLAISSGVVLIFAYAESHSSN